MSQPMPGELEMKEGMIPALKLFSEREKGKWKDDCSTVR